MTLCSCKRNGLIRKIEQISKFMTQIITINIMPNAAQSRGNQTMKVGQLLTTYTRFHLFFPVNDSWTQIVIEYNKRNLYLKNHAENETGD